MAIDSVNERTSATNQLTGLRVLFPNGAIDQDTRQASARTALAVLALAPIVALDAAIFIDSAIDATVSNESAIDAALLSDAAIDATILMN